MWAILIKAGDKFDIMLQPKAARLAESVRYFIIRHVIDRGHSLHHV
jgi:hypothetical protein